jgi:hypothetical protein
VVRIDDMTTARRAGGMFGKARMIYCSKVVSKEFSFAHIIITLRKRKFI